MAERTAGMTYLEVICVEQRDQIQFPIYALRMTPKKGNSRPSAKRWWLCANHLRHQLNRGHPATVIVMLEEAVKIACARNRLIGVQSHGHVVCRECAKLARKPS